MAEKRRQIEQTRHGIDTLAIPTQEGADGKRMPKAMKVRRCLTGRNLELKCRQELMEGATFGPIGVRFFLPKENTGPSGEIGPDRDCSRCRKPGIAVAIFGPKGTKRSLPNFVF